jgi:hypothetical protein
MRERGELLRRIAPFNRLTTAEAMVLRTLMTVRRRRPGDVIVHGKSVFVIEAGEAEVMKLLELSNADYRRYVCDLVNPLRPSAGLVAHV